MRWGGSTRNHCGGTSLEAHALGRVQVATSDGVLRAYTFGNMSPEAPRVVAPPRPLPAAPAGIIPAGAAGTAGQGSAEAKAAAVALPSDDEEAGEGEDDWEQVMCSLAGF